MDLYGILHLDISTVTLFEDANYSPFTYSQLYRDSLSRNYHLLKRYSKNYQKVPYKLFLDKVKTIAMQERKQFRNSSQKNLFSQRKSSPELPAFRLDHQTSINNKPHNRSSRKSVKQKPISPNLDFVLNKRMSLKSQEINTDIERRRFKFPPKKKQLNIVWLGQRQLLNNDKIQRYLTNRKKYILLNTNKENRRVLNKSSQKLEIMQDSLSVQIKQNFESMQQLYNKQVLEHFQKQIVLALLSSLSVKIKMDIDWVYGIDIKNSFWNLSVCIRVIEVS